MKAVLVFLFFSCLFVAIQGAEEELSSWTYTVTLPAGNDNTCPLPWQDGNVCAGSNSNLCLGSWDGVFTFLDQTPSDAVWMGLQFTLFGSFGCGEIENTTEIVINVNGVEYMDWFLDPKAWTCGCPIVADTEIAYRVFPNSTNTYATTYKYEIGKTNQASLVGIDACVCAIEVIGFYIGAAASSSPGGIGAVGITFIVLGILAVIVIVAVLAVIGFLYYKKRTAYTTL